MKKRNNTRLNTLNIITISKNQLIALKGGSEGGYNVGDIDTEEGFDD